MGLQLRLTHPLGERLVDLEARPMQRPIVVGRAADADVEVPSSEVSKRHCLMFTEGGRWFVVDARSTSGTYVNGHRLTGAAQLESGQVIALGAGASPATLTVDPFGLGVVEATEDGPEVAGAPELAARPASSVPPAPRTRPAMPPPIVSSPAAGGARGVVLPPPPPPTVPRPGYGAPGAYRPTIPKSAAVAQPPGAPASEWPQGSQTTHLYVPKKKGSSSTTIAITVVLTLTLLIGAGWYLKRAYDQKQYEAEHPPVIIVTKTRARSTTVATTEPAPATQVVRVRAAAPEPPPATEPAAPDPRRQDPEWQAVEQARYEEPVIAIVKFNDYLDRFPDSPFKADVAKYIDEAVDRIWWKRIADLFAERDAARKEIADRRPQIKQSQDPEFKKGLEEEIAKFEQQIKDVDGIVRGQMKYTGQTPPNMYDSNELKLLRASRDAKNYTTWKEAVLSSIKRSRGERLPWRSSR